MGYKRQATIFALEFPEFKDDEGQPLMVWTKSVPIGRLMSLVRLSSLADFGDDHKYTEEDVKNIEKLFQVFSKALVKWNLEEQEDALDDDSPWVPVPATYEAVMGQDIDFMLKIVLRWVQTISNVTESLGKDSTSGQRFPEGHGQTVPQSLNLESLMRPSSS